MVVKVTGHENTEWMNQARYRDHCGVGVNTVMKLKYSYKAT
jgi:hypothetical protein